MPEFCFNWLQCVAKGIAGRPVALPNSDGFLLKERLISKFTN